MLSPLVKKAFKKFVYYFIISISIASLAFFIDTYYSDFTNLFDKKLKDYMFKLRGVQKQDDTVVIVDIDEKSLNELGQWPWSRDKVAKILENLTLSGAGVIGLDIVFAEKDRASPHKVLKDLGYLDKDVANFDEMLEYTVANTPTILGYQFVLKQSKFIKQDDINIKAIVAQRGNEEARDLLIEAIGIVPNYEELQKSGFSSGFFNCIPDESGVVRAVPLVIKYKDQLYPSLALEILRATSGINTIVVNYTELGIENIQIGDFKIPTDRNGNFIVNYRGPSKTFKYFSAVDIYNNDFDKSDFDSKAVLIGTTAAGLFDLRATPFEAVFPGVEIHANIIDNILKQDFLYLPSWIDGANSTVLYVVAFLSVFFIAYLPIWMKLLSIIFMVGTVFYASYYVLFAYGIEFNVFLPIVTIVIVSIITIFINYWFELRQKKLIKNKFASKVSKDVMENLLMNADTNIFSAMDKEVTIFFSDVRNFTNISETMSSPHLLIQFMNEYMDPMTEIIIKQKGTVDKYIGDAIMAYWNAPSDVEDHADRAVIATLEQLYKLKELNDKILNDDRYQSTVKMCKEKNIPILDIGIGINTGEVTVGEMGSSKRSDYTVIGDAVNLGSRLESLCKFYGSKCNISNFTKDRLKGKYIYRYIDKVTVKGKSEPVDIWQVIDFDKDDEVDTLYHIPKEKLYDELSQYNDALQLYRDAKFEQALKLFKKIDALKYKTNQKIYNIYIQRCEHYIEYPPKDFNGVYEHTTKG